MTVSITDLYQILADKIGKDEAKALTSFVEEKIEQQVEQKATILATKADLLDSERSINTKLWILVVMIFGLYGTIIGFGMTFLSRLPVTTPPAIHQTDSSSKK